jgi:hypothetical protein
VEAAFVEDDGGVSIIRRPWAEPAKVSDVDDEAAKDMAHDTREKPDAIGLNRTDAPEWLR